MTDLDKLTAEIGTHVAYRWGRDPFVQLAKIAEEAGEVVGAPPTPCATSWRTY